MNCSATSHIPGTNDSNSLKIASLVTLAFGSVTGNIFILLRLGITRKKTSAFDRILKSQCVWGILLLVSVVPVHIVVLVLGDAGVSEAKCAGCGMLFQTVLGTWSTLQPLLLFERYTKVSTHTEHLALFSKVNIKLMLWGTVLMHAMISLGPIYGWGQYTHGNERYRFLAQPIVSNSSDLLPESFQNVSVVNEKMMAANLSDLFPEQNVESISVTVVPSVIQLDVVVKSGARTICIQKQVDRGIIGERLTELLADNTESYRQFPGNQTRFEVKLDDFYRQRIETKDHVYCESTVCEVNYQFTRKEDDLYVLLTFFFQLVIPFTLMTYFSARIIFSMWISSERQSLVLTNKEYDCTIESLVISNVAIILVLPYFGCNLAIRAGHILVTGEHFTGRFLVYFSTLWVVTVHLFMHRHEVFDEMKNWTPGCGYRRTCTENGYRKSVGMGDDKVNTEFEEKVTEESVVNTPCVPHTSRM